MYFFYDFKKGIKTNLIKNMWYFIEIKNEKLLLKFSKGIELKYYFKNIKKEIILFSEEYLNNAKIKSIGTDKEVREKYPQYFI